MIPRSHLAIILATLIAIFWLVGTSFWPKKSALETPARKTAFRQRLVAVGDLHGDLENAQKVLRMAKIIDQNANWIGGTDILVQTGDVVDRGTFAFDIYRMMQRLRGQAADAGGQLVSILGNHEIMNAIGDWRYVTDEDIKHCGSTAQRQKDMSIDGWLGQEWLANYSSTALVALADHPQAPRLSFTHGSLRPSYPNLTPYPGNINRLGHSLLTKALTPPMAMPYPPNPYPGLPRALTDAEAELYAEGGPFWWRGLAQSPDEKLVCGWAEQLKAKLGVRRIIGGHTPNFERIVDRCEASIIIIDTGISSAYGGVLSALEIIYTLSPTAPNRIHHQDPLLLTQGTEYVEREEVHAIYENRRRQLAVEERTIRL
ncbi:Metallo-dependent phosphatase-like protein [Kockovaella imperatae]|uniref:Metallo-dependent phosphatase-like protein n=1 Tax=Kockovaella imperatae TaxID=4999 RepID=A0A1Y1UEC8_9TREE|nr:Metallo-dependent phosphatase-like protein [Kockovaella imperatae]ORX36411.1 Metallo-dependent phosphatase-like protein [Kockovaella imperatae]